MNHTAQEVGLGLGQGRTRINEIMDSRPSGSSLSSVPWGLHAGCGGTCKLSHEAMTTATRGEKAEKH